MRHYLGPSFSPIVAFNEHGALPHYSATPESDYVIGTNGILLVDSGGQYLDGTTDITRTIAIGKPSAASKTRLFSGTQGNDKPGTGKISCGIQKVISSIFWHRKALWENGLNYGHGTGHGVGFCLNVHEGPQSIGPVFGTESKTVMLEPGMLISDEPAVYRRVSMVSESKT